MFWSVLLYTSAIAIHAFGQELPDWEGVTAVMEQAVKDGAFPGAVAVVGDASGVLYSQSVSQCCFTGGIRRLRCLCLCLCCQVGSYTYGASPPFSPDAPMSKDTRFDMASCTKVVSTTSVAAILYEDGFLDLNMRVADSSLLGPSFAQNGKQDITVLNLLLHNAGFPPDPSPNYWDEAFGCPQTSHAHPL